MAVRNLRLMVLDDGSTTETSMFVDSLYRFDGQWRGGKFGWERHCYEIFDAPTIGFELLSADINYAQDFLDPGHPAENDRNSWGLVHALGALARRRQWDRFGNALPLAWEIRSFTPYAFEEDADATRTYGLLRCLAARPRVGEDLFDCIAREFREQHGSELPLDPEALRKRSLRDLFVTDLAHQPPFDSDADKALLRLLPLWRRRFFEAVSSGECTLSPERLARAFEAIRKKSIVKAEPNSTLSIPLTSGARGSHTAETEALRLVSVFADKIERDREGDLSIDLHRQYDDLCTSAEKNVKFNVIEWYESLVAAATGADNAAVPMPEQFNRVAKEAARRIAGRERSSDSGNLDSMLTDRRLARGSKKGMLFCFLVCYLYLRGEDEPSPGVVNKRFQLDGTNEHTWLAPLRRYSAVFSGRGARDLADQLVEALKGEKHDIEPTWRWLKPGLLSWLQTEPDASEMLKSARRRAPGLFVPES